MGRAGDGELVRSWAHQGLVALGEARAEIDALNVYPVPDGDTGTNLYLTLEAGVAAMDRALRDVPDGEATLDLAGPALVRGLLLGARGNSGAIVSQLGAGLVAGLLARSDQPDGAAYAGALGEGVAQAYDAVAAPVEGTLLTVARVAAEAAAEAAARDPQDLRTVVLAVAGAAREALSRTPEQLEVLARAGVVDSGGRGLVVLYDTLAELVTGRRRPAPVTTLPVPRLEEVATHGGDYEVMYLLEADAVDGLRAELRRIGDSVVVVGADGLWNVHVHTDDIGAAIEAGIEAGRPYRVRVEQLRDVRHEPAPGRTVVVAVEGAGLAALVRAAGGVPLEPVVRVPSTAELLASITAAGTAEVVLLPGSSDALPAAQAAARSAADEGVHVTVVPSRSVVQSLAALAVHDPAAAAEADAVGMTRAALDVRYGAVTTAVKEALTTGGRCRPGDAIGTVEGDVVEVGSTLAQVAVRIVDRLLGFGGELLTVVVGADADHALVGAVQEHVRSHHPGVELAVHTGGQPRWPLVVGAE